MCCAYQDVLVGVVELFDQAIAHAVGGGEVCVGCIEVKASSRDGILDVVHNLTLDGSHICAQVTFHQIPQLANLLVLSCMVHKLRLLPNHNN